MSKFNQTVSPQKAKSYEDAWQYEKSLVEDWMNFLFSSYLEGGFYENAGTQTERFIDLTDRIYDSLGPEFLAKASVFARNELGMRSAAQLVAAYLNNKTFAEKRGYYNYFIHRPDDIAEIFAILETTLPQKRSHALIRGAGDYLSSMDRYTLSRYKLQEKNWNMYDLINICHAHSKVIDAYKADERIEAETWRASISAAEDDLSKAANWVNLVEEHKLAYLALMRNLRNILDSADKLGYNLDWVQEYLIPQITNEGAVRNSLVFPYQIYTAYLNINDAAPVILAALAQAFLYSVQNMPELPGTTAIMLDVSGSMESEVSAHSRMTIKQLGACYAAAMYLKNRQNTIFIKFGSYAKEQHYSGMLSPFTLINKMAANDNCDYGTSVSSAFQELRQPVSRILLVSDQQTMGDTHSLWGWNPNGLDIYNDYCRRYGPCHLYSFDLGNYKSQVANPNNPNVHLLTSLTDKVVSLIPYLEDGGKLEDMIWQCKYYKNEPCY